MPAGRRCPPSLPGMHLTLRLVVVSKNEVAFVLVVLIVTIVVVVFVVVVIFVVVVVVIVIIILVDAVVSARNSSNHKQTIVCEVKILGSDNRRQTTSNGRGC